MIADETHTKLFVATLFILLHMMVHNHMVVGQGITPKVITTFKGQVRYHLEFPKYLLNGM